MKGTDERISQPDHLAIVYSTDEEETEYLRYVKYLSANGFVLGDAEMRDVEDLPDISGLRMLRVRVVD